MADQTKLPYGLLNPVEREKFTTRVNGGEDSLEYMREAAFESLYSPTIKPDGNYVGFVLFVDKIKRTFSSFDRIWDVASGNDVRPQIGTAKVRVPEIHSMIKEPESFQDNVRIDLHHTFEYNVDEIDEIEEGDLVEVVFYDGQNRFRPRILTKFKGKMALGEKKDPRGAHENNSGYRGDNGYTPPLDVEPHPFQESLTNVQFVPGQPYDAMNRIKVTNDGFRPLLPNSPLLVTVSTHKTARTTQKLHILAAQRFEALRRAAAEAGFNISASSGYRRPKYEESFAEYKERMMQNYVFEKGGKHDYRKFMKKGRTASEAQEVAFNLAKGTVAYGPKSPHNTGLAVDIVWEGSKANPREVDVRGSMPGGKRKINTRRLNGTTIRHAANKYGSNMNDDMRETSLHKWLERNAWRYGATPLMHGGPSRDGEAWHWEFHLTLSEFLTGQDHPDRVDISERVIETGVRSGKRTNSKYFRF